VKKRTLPTLSGNPRAAPARGGRSRVDHPVPPQERGTLDELVIAIAHTNQGAIASKLAVQLCAAFVRDGVGVSALVSIDNRASAPEAQETLSGMIEAGARQAVMFRKPDQDVAGALKRVLAQLAGTPYVIAYGNTLPQVFRPYFTVVVTGHRRGLMDADRLVLQAELEVTAPGPELATLLARRIQEL
jgi:hypothetical protein